MKQSPSDEMVNIVDSKSTVERLVGSSPTLGTTYLNKQVEIMRKSNGARYYGKVVGFRWKENKFCLSGLVIMQKDGSFKAAPKYNNKRWFSFEKFSIFVL